MSATKSKCDRCGLESEQADAFNSYPRSFSTKSWTLCRACFHEKNDKVLQFQFWAAPSLFLLSWLASILVPSLSLGATFTNIALFPIFIFAGTVLHEAGHAVAGRLAGLRVFTIEIGRGRVIAEFLWWGMRWKFRSVLFGGRVHGAARTSERYRLRRALFILGGPVTNVALLGLGVWGATYFGSGLGSGWDPWVVFVLSNAVMLLYSLYPRRFARRNRANDMLLLWETWRQGKAQSEQAPAHWYLLTSQESYRRGRREEAAKWLEEGLRLFPRDYGLEWKQAHILMARGEYAAARKALVLLLGRYGRFGAVRYSVFNSIAYVDALSGDSELLAEAEVCSRLALEKYAWNVYYLGTRGSVLVEMGQYAEGLQLLHWALKRHRERPGRALNACYIGIAERRRGNLDESRSYFAMARRLDPNCWLLAREKEG